MHDGRQWGDGDGTAGLNQVDMKLCLFHDMLHARIMMRNQKDVELSHMKVGNSTKWMEKSID